MNVKGVFKNKIVVITALGLLAVTGGVIFFAARGQKAGYDFVQVGTGDVAESVSLTGQVQSAKSVDLAFERGGKVNAVYVKAGDSVKSGKLLISISNTDSAADLAQARASVLAAQAQVSQATAAVQAQTAKLNELKAGARPEQVQLQQIQITNAQNALIEAGENMVDKIRDAYTKCDDAVRNHADQFFNNPGGPVPQLNLPVTDSQLKINLENGRLAAGPMLFSWNAEIPGLTSSGDFSVPLDNAKRNVQEILGMFDNLTLAINSVPSANFPAATTSAWKLDVSSVRTTLNAALSALSGADEKMTGARSALLTAQQQLSVVESGASADQIAAQQAAVDQSKAALAMAQAQVAAAGATVQKIDSIIAKGAIYSPVDGVVNRIDPRVGEIVSPNVTVISVSSAAQFEVESKIAEADVSKIKVGDVAQANLDAYGTDTVFDSKVVFIDPAATIVNGVPTYTVKFQFIGEDQRIKSGMTANLTVMNASKNNVVVVPARAVTKDGEREYVLVKGPDGRPVQREVQTGIRGSDGYVEIVSGLSAGDSIVNFGL